MGVSIEDKDQKILEAFESDANWEDRYARIIRIGKEFEGLPEGERVDDLLVKGCQSQVWIHAQLTDAGTIRFRGDSDAMIVRGLVALLLELFDNETPDVVLSYKPNFIESLGLSQRLSPSRANGLNSMLKQIKYYAVAFQSLGSLNQS